MNFLKNLFKSKTFTQIEQMEEPRTPAIDYIDPLLYKMCKERNYEKVLYANDFFDRNLTFEKVRLRLENMAGLTKENIDKGNTGAVILRIGTEEFRVLIKSLPLEKIIKINIENHNKKIYRD